MPAPAPEETAAEISQLRTELNDERSRNRRLQAFIDILQSRSNEKRHSQRVRSR